MEKQELLRWAFDSKPYARTVPKSYRFGVSGLLFEGEQMPQVVDIKHFRME